MSGRAEPRIRWSGMPATGRRQSFGPALRLLHRTRGRGAVMVETGTLRHAGNRESDGWSTLVFGWFAAATGGRLFTVDIDPGALVVAREVTRPFEAVISYVEADARRFLTGWDRSVRGAIDFLYLDSLDYEDPAASEQHCLAEARAAAPSLAEGALVLIDDTGAAGVGQRRLRYWGKGALVIPFLLAEGFRVEAITVPQVLLRRVVITDWDVAPRQVEGLEVEIVAAGCIVRHPESGRVHLLNHTAAAVLQLCTGTIPARDFPELIRALYGLAGAPAAEVADCLTRLLREDLVR